MTVDLDETAGPSDRPLRGLSLRRATKADLDILTDMRKECGWGWEKLPARVEKNRDWILCVFTKEVDGEIRDVGMGGWGLDWPEYPFMASRADKVVYLTSLFIRHAYQGLGLGGTAMDLLEREARDTFGGQVVTLDTARYAYDSRRDLQVGHDSNDREKVSSNLSWYVRRGYEEFRDPVPLFPDPRPDDPDYKIVAAFLRKSM
ncbi:hypothetical protein BD324DRAFT_621787 [Kockovaella imperatae]|uniref:N-acetyltransferase domain-containing protein n=1 Tax=Kockovaella imperatae TaxID=4999 RepID=A0A1Y1UKY1_9TREE|nr:hypothetical protein BD324DRAFT_621787 [Kockovaella imperatae]ORX38649.1 hypothetical protein BD324DRAFT_621787 [Kockovaella imperatae]